MESPTQTFLQPVVTRNESKRIDFAPTRDRGDEPTPYDPKIENYTLGQPLGSGGMGWVYDAFDLKLKRAVAVKVLSDRFSQTEVARRFKLEAQILARLKHPNVVAVFHSGQTDDGRLFFSMQRIEGGTLADAADGLRKRGAGAIVALLAKVARAVQYFHENSIWHRDLKPSNILLDASGEPFIADFGVGKLLDGEDTTLGFHRVGTHAYMAPEMIKFGTKGCTAATDVWALGVIAYQLLSGVRPFGGDSQDSKLTQRICTEALVPVARQKKPANGFDPALEAILEMALAKEPEHRYPTAAALAEDLEAWAAGKPVGALFHKRRKSSGWLLVGLLVVLAAGAIGFALAPRSKPAPQPTSDGLFDRLARGERVTIVDDQGKLLPGVKPLVPRMPAPIEGIEGALQIGCVDIGLFEIAGGTTGLKLKLSGEVMIFSGTNGSEAGFYFGRRPFVCDKGPMDSLMTCGTDLTASFAPNANQPGQSMVSSRFFYFPTPTRPFGSNQNVRIEGICPDPPGRYIPLEVVFQDGLVSAKADGRDFEESKFPSLESHQADELGKKNVPIPSPLFTGGFGLFAQRCSALFRDVWLEAVPVTIP